MFFVVKYFPMESFVVNVFWVIVLTSSGVVLAGWLTPIPWKLPYYDRQLIVQKVAGTLVVVSALIICIDKWIRFAL